MSEDAQDLVTLVTARSAFEAHTIVTLLDDEGFEACAFDAPGQSFDFSIEPYLHGVTVKVRRHDVEQARQALLARRNESQDIDWGKVDIGEREDYLPLHQPGRMPLLARIAWLVTLLVLLGGTIGGGLLVIWPLFAD